MQMIKSTTDAEALTGSTNDKRGKTPMDRHKRAGPAEANDKRDKSQGS
jgi:hypothetical protein